MERASGRLQRAGDSPEQALRRSAWDVLDIVRRSAVLRRIPEASRNAWGDRILELVERSHSPGQRMAA